MDGVPFFRRRGSHIGWAECLRQCLGAVRRTAEQPVLERHQDKGLQCLFRHENLIFVVHKGGHIGTGFVIVSGDELILCPQDALQ